MTNLQNKIISTAPLNKSKQSLRGFCQLVVKATLIGTALMSIGSSIGCAKKKSNPTAAAEPAPIVNPPGGPNGLITNAYGEAQLSKVSKSALQAYAGHVIANPTEVKIKVDLFDTGNESFGGRVAISYKDGTVIYDKSYQESRGAQLRNGECVPLGNIDPNSTQHNRWVVINGKKIWHGFFQDCNGGIVLVIDKSVDQTLGDGTITKKLSGSIWFKNFQTGPGYNTMQGNKACWEIDIGPFDCRTFLVKDQTTNISSESTLWSVHTETSIYPNLGWFSDNRADYTKLAEFTNLDSNEAFNLK